MAIFSGGIFYPFTPLDTWMRKYVGSFESGVLESVDKRSDFDSNFDPKFPLTPCQSAFGLVPESAADSSMGVADGKKPFLQHEFSGGFSGGKAITSFY